MIYNFKLKVNDYQKIFVWNICVNFSSQVAINSIKMYNIFYRVKIKPQGEIKMSENKILATVDGVNITEAEVNAFINTLTKDQQMYANNPQFRQQCLEEIINIPFG